MPYKDPEVRKQKSKERWDIWAKRNPEKYNRKMREWRLRNPIHMLYLTAKRRAAKAGTEFNISREDMPEIPEICPIALIPLRQRDDGKKGPCDNSPTLDRVNPKRGYVKGNIRVVSHRGNRWKSEMEIEDVRRLLKYMETESAPGLEGQTVNKYAEAFRNAGK